MEVERGKEKYYIVLKNGHVKHEVFEIFLYIDQVVINPSMPYIKDFHFTQHQPSEKWSDIGWHLKNNNTKFVVLDRRNDFVGNKIKEIGFVTFRSTTLKQCKIFNRKTYNDKCEIDPLDNYLNYTFYFFRASKDVILDDLQQILKNNKLNLKTYCFYFESKLNITIGGILIPYNIDTIQFLDLTSIGGGIIQFYEYVRIDKNGNIKKESVVKPTDNSIRINNSNFLPCGGVIIE